MPAACASTWSRPTRSITSHTTARCACSLVRARWPIRRVRSTTTRTSQCTIDLTLEAVGRPWGGEPEWEEGEVKPDLDPEKMFARGHTEQHMSITGAVTVGEERFDITDALGLRDHSWGPRFWQNVWWYRWLTVNLGPKLGFALTISGSQEDPDARHVGGFLYDVDRYGDNRWVTVRDMRPHVRLRRRVVPDQEPRDGHDRRPRVRGRR